MLYVQQPALLRMMRASGAAVVILLTSGAAFAQMASAPCFEFIPARPRIEPPSPMLVDKCTGRTWLLTRTSRGTYRWASIQSDGETPKAPDRPATDRGHAERADKQGGGGKCFTFNNRKFCE
ncbi:MAG: hypothetical protein ACO1NY_00090 [Pseudorhodoplanes sp.]